METEQSVVRDSKGRLAKGSRALNPGGRNTREIKMLRDLRALGPRAISKLGKLLDDPNGSVALGAAKEILDRNLGKVKQNVQVDVTSTHVLHLQALEELAARKKQQIIEAQAIDITDNATLDRITSHDGPGDPGAPMVIEAGERAGAETPQPLEAGGAAACAPTPPPTHENP
ncbi:MAG: hypothetical protein OEZ19_00195 [Paracoccaceae bacterium]|nr:hypothetical protein [Paracoccaceae bacterium]